MFSQALYAIDDLSQAFAGNDEARQRKAFELSKKLSIVQTTMATIETTVQAFKEAQKNPLNQATGGAYAFGQAAIAAAFGLAQNLGILEKKRRKLSMLTSNSMLP